MDNPEPDWPASFSIQVLVLNLQRRWKTIIALGLLGGLLGVATALTVGFQPNATTTLILSHDPTRPVADAIQTDLGLLTTRDVAARVVDDLGLAEDSSEFLSSVDARAETSQLVVVSVSGPTSAEAIERADSIATAFLDYRSEVLEAQSDALVREGTDRAATLDARVAVLDVEVQQLQEADTPETEAKLNALLDERDALAARAIELRNDAEQIQISTSAAVESSRVIDPAVAEISGTRPALAGFASGVVGGVLVAAAWVLAQGLLTNKPRLRSETSAIIGAPVIVSVGRVRPNWGACRRARSLVAARLVDLIASDSSAANGVALLDVNNERDTRVLAVELIRMLAETGRPITAVDLTETGRLARTLGTRAVCVKDSASAQGQGEIHDLPVVVVRPQLTPPSASTPRTTSGMANPQARKAPTGTSRRFILAVGEASPTIGADHIASWAQVAILVVRPGAASRERLSSSAAVLRNAELELTSAIVTRVDKTDDSLGQPAPRVSDTGAPRPLGRHARGTAQATSGSRQ